MKKTVRTIAWICLVLGLIGVAVDVGIYVNNRAGAAQMREAVAAGESPNPKGRFEDLNQEDFENFPRNQGGGNFGRRGFGFGYSPLLLAAGPVLTVTGAVLLIVIRKPKDSDGKEKKEKGKKE